MNQPYKNRFHASYPGTPDLWHTYCPIHPDFGTCGVEEDADRDLIEHAKKQHPVEYEYRVMSSEGEQSGPITSLEDAESGRYSTGHDGDYIERRPVRVAWERMP